MISVLWRHYIQLVLWAKVQRGCSFSLYCLFLLFITLQPASRRSVYQKHIMFATMLNPSYIPVKQASSPSDLSLPPRVEHGVLLDDRFPVSVPRAQPPSWASSSCTNSCPSWLNPSIPTSYAATPETKLLSSRCLSQRLELIPVWVSAVGILGFTPLWAHVSSIQIRHCFLVRESFPLLSISPSSGRPNGLIAIKMQGNDFVKMALTEQGAPLARPISVKVATDDSQFSQTIIWALIYAQQDHSPAWTNHKGLRWAIVGALAPLIIYPDARRFNFTRRVSEMRMDFAFDNMACFFHYYYLMFGRMNYLCGRFILRN